MLSAIASILILTRIGLLFLIIGDTGYAAIAAFVAEHNGDLGATLTLAFIAFTSGLLIKSGVVPFHTWVPDSDGAAPAAVSVLLGGIITKVSGVYMLIRVFHDVFLQNHAVGNVLLAMGLISVLLGALSAIGQDDIKRMLAYSSISQIGYILLGVATGSPLGYVGALLHFFNHATFKGLLFVNAAAIRMQTGERAMSNMGGLAARMPVTGVTAIIAFLSTAGIPPLSGFWSKLLIIMALWNVSPALACVALGASVLTLAYLLIMQKKVFFGKAEGAMADATEASRGIVTAEVLLASVNVLVGLAFPLILLYLQSVHML